MKKRVFQSVSKEQISVCVGHLSTVRPYTVMVSCEVIRKTSRSSVGRTLRKFKVKQVDIGYITYG